MTASAIHDLHWKSIPMGAIKGFEEWYRPYLGRGVYMLVLASTERGYVGFYVGKSNDLGCRRSQHVRDWFVEPKEEFFIPNDAEAFLRDPIAVFNTACGLSQGNPNRHEVAGKMLCATWFCFAEVHDTRPERLLENVEYVLQERLKTHVGIMEKGHVGDAGFRFPPTTGMTIRNHFGRPFLNEVLPGSIHFEPGAGVQS